jgi:hypothetical protein
MQEYLRILANLITANPQAAANSSFNLLDNARCR